MTREMETWLSGSRVGNNSVVEWYGPVSVCVLVDL